MEKYQAQVEEIKANPLRGKSGRALAIYDLEKNRISRIVCIGVDQRLLEEITFAVNNAFDKADCVAEEK